MNTETRIDWRVPIGIPTRSQHIAVFFIENLVGLEKSHSVSILSWGYATINQIIVGFDQPFVNHQSSLTHFNDNKLR